MPRLQRIFLGAAYFDNDGICRLVASFRAASKKPLLFHPVYKVLHAIVYKRIYFMMHFIPSVLVAGLVGLAQAQVPSGFTPQATTKLEVIFNSTMVNTAGQQLAKACKSPDIPTQIAILTCLAAATQPQLALSSAMIDASQTYMFVMLDLDVPPADGSTERRTLLHCMNTGFKATKQQLMGAATLLASSEKGPAPYIPPGPPATDTVAHRYVELLFPQPASLNIQASAFAGVQDRIGFDIQSFMSQNGVSAPLAANFFRVDGRISATASGTGSATVASGAAATPTGTPQPFTGAAGEISVPYGTAGLLSGVALFAVLVL